MDIIPLVSIVIPVYNDEEVIAGALDSCLRQTLSAIEVIVVDDASSDGTTEVVQQYAERDPRVRIIRQEQNMSAYQARAVGIRAARSTYLLFLDGDDELADNAAEAALAKAKDANADLVQFGIEVVGRDGSTGGGFELRLQPRNGSLRGVDVLRGLFPIDEPAQGQLWRFLFRTQILVDAYALMPDDLVLPRVNDLPITFLAAALAKSYESLPDRLYRYHFGRGGSGQKVHDLGWAVFYSGAINSIDTIAPAVEVIAERSADPAFVLATYESARLSIVAYTTYYLAEHTSEDLLAETFAHLYTCAPAREIVHATAKFRPGALEKLAAHTSRIDLSERPARSILLTTNILQRGGVTGVLLSQARLLLAAGFRVTIAAREAGSDESLVPRGAAFVQIDDSTSLADQLAQWADACRENGVDLVIDHHWLYANRWPAFALAARAEGAATIGWAHNFAGRSVLLGITRLDFQTRNMGALAQLIVLSPTDVAFWKLRGMPRVAYLPNPPSPLLAEASRVTAPRKAPTGRPLELVWWGRLEQRTKRVSELVQVAAELQRLGVDFRLRIIGPDWNETTAAQLNELAERLAVGDRVQAVGPLYGEDLLAAIDSSDIFLNTSIIEGYPLTIPEAQSRGLPVAMYEMPWLALAEGNEGIVTAPQRDAAGLAAEIAAIAADPELYRRLSAASVSAAERELSYDFATLYQQLVSGTLPASHSPEPTIDDAKRLIDLTILFAEESAKARKPPERRGDRHKSPRRAAESVDRSLSSRLVRKATPAARTVIDIAPWLRPAALRLRHALLRR
ncbi:glycosyltransferase [Microbacterium sulfonylureivorans]|uniref:glycosyltransferase n=1 Tax=Microbacterium sulfonylureivorans TaxID=2486854 RepID=UPI000FDBAA7B|nr:glycosyltransferase [Microbacterium sulfonylureivorans]